MFDISDVLTTVKLDLGIYTIALPFDNADEFLEKVIMTQTLKVFSIYRQNYEKFYIPYEEMNIIRRIERETTIILPERITNFGPILSVRNVRYYEGSDIGMSALDMDYSVSNTGMYAGVSTGRCLTHTVGLARRAMLANATARLSGTMIPKLHFSFKAPCELTLRNYILNRPIMVEVGFKHEEGLSSIPDLSQDKFEELAALDCKRALYNLCKANKTIASAFGQINIDIDDWANADQERKEFVREIRRTYHLDAVIQRDI